MEQDVEYMNKITKCVAYNWEHAGDTNPCNRITYIIDVYPLHSLQDPIMTNAGIFVNFIL